jgi:hypothetical protein
MTKLAVALLFLATLLKQGQTYWFEEHQIINSEIPLPISKLILIQ